MTRASQDGNRAELRGALSHGLRTMAVATVFGALALFALAGPLGMFFSGGHTQDGVMLAQTLTILALSTPFMSANFMMSRVFYANEDARTPFFIQLVLAVVNVVAAFFIQFLPFDQIIFAIAILYTGGNILSVMVSAFFLRRLLGHLDGPRVASSYIRMGYAALGSAIAGAGALWLMGSYQADGFAWSSRPAALVTIVVVGPVMLAVYLVLLKRPPGHGTAGPAAAAAGTPAARPGRPDRKPVPEPVGAETGAGEAVAHEAPPARPAPERATTSVDTGLIPRISGEFDAASFRAGPRPGRRRTPPGWARRTAATCPRRNCPAPPRAARAGREIPLPGRRTYQGEAGHNPYFPFDRRRKK